MPLNPYVVVANCKTESCRNVIALCRRDRRSGPVDRPGASADGFFYKCGKCGQTHMYRDQDARIEQMTEPLPATWLNIW